MRPVLMLLACCGVAVAADSATAPVQVEAADETVIDAPAFLSATGAEAVGPDAEGILIAAVQVDIPAALAGVQAGDRLLAIDGLRVHSGSEYNLVKNLLKPGSDSEHWSLRRGRTIVETDLVGLRAWGSSGVTWEPEPPQVAQAFRDAGLTVDRGMAAELDHLPARLGHAVAAWHRAHPGAPAPAWLGHLATDWSMMIHSGALSGTPEEMPVPLLADVERFWHALAKDKPEDAPSPARWGCTAAFAAIFYPYPPMKNLDFGKPALADATLAGQLQTLYEVNGSTPTELQQAAAALADGGYRGGATNADRFIGQCAAALLDPNNHGGWPFRSNLIWEQDARTAMIADLQARLKAGDKDEDLLRYALIGPLTIEHQDAAVAALITAIAAHSRFLGEKALDTAQATVDMWRRGSTVDKMAFADAYIGTLGSAEAPHGIIYPWALARSSTLADQAGSSDLWRANFASLPEVFRGCPGQVAAALAPDAAVIAANAATMDTVVWQCAGLEAKLATDPVVHDGAQAVLLADMMATSGAALTEHARDAIAAGYARNGDFATAVAWERGAIQLCNTWAYRERFLARWGDYLNHRPYDPSDHAHGATISAPSADGSLTCIGQRSAEGVAVGPWRFLHGDGTVQGSGGYDAQGLPEGVWRSYGADGKPRIECGFLKGRRFGRFRAWNDAGNLVVEGWYRQADGNIPLRFGRWTWYNGDGTRHEAGCFIDNHRAGTWTIWNPAGDVTASAHFTDDQADGPWPDATTPAMPAYMPPVAPEVVMPGTPADKF